MVQENKIIQINNSVGYLKLKLKGI